MIADPTLTHAYFATLGMWVESVPETRSRARQVWQVHAGDRLYRMGGKHTFATLKSLWRAWYCLQPELERNRACAVDLVVSEQKMGASEKAEMTAWIAFHTQPRAAHRRRLSVGGWPYEVMPPTAPMKPLIECGEPWTSRPMPAPIDADSVNKAMLEDPVWRERGLVVGRLSTQFSRMFASALGWLRDDADRTVLEACLPVAPGNSVARRRL